MILKSFELNKLKLENYNFYLFYGDNEGLKEDTIKNFFVKKIWSLRCNPSINFSKLRSKTKSVPEST